MHGFERVVSVKPVFQLLRSFHFSMTLRSKAAERYQALV
jgi:hypothetical protein